MVPNSNGRKPLTSTTATLRSMGTRRCGMSWVTDRHERQYARKIGRMSAQGGRTAIGSVPSGWHSGGMDAYPSSSAPRRRASWCVRLTRRISYAVREIHFANRQAAALMLRYGQYEPDRAAATY